ncbi:MAG: DNA primase [Alphaproteobacteria bacterium]|jgi:DNA primase|nr:DNA primase [Alphaproteobacteria bacterium]MDP6589316.1 DNA primase [Alphaproteobacteria bacterium]MDP6818078.1 DNA primase [Alphaproteobacteria bacterium]|tara:strand:+ start:1883 stop:3754 length:1872 start_codon:yes stop_codon:yes gene_type:complete
MAFTPQFLDEIRARVPLSDVIGRRVRLIRKGREHSALCPFHNEKTPSFTVSDDKGFFHCFGCGAHGDVIGFVMRDEGLAFPEAVEKLAGEAGLEVPKETPRDRARAEEQLSLYAVMEVAAKFFESELGADSGAAAGAYLKGRGLKGETIKGFRLGYAPDSKSALKSALIGKNISPAMLVTAGLLIEPEGGGAVYDRFRNRVMFPIQDRRGRVIAFGGRALGEAQAKYLNSPETPVFHKGTVLYGMHLARGAARKSGRIIAVEGYMDVIALHQGGLVETVAPLGTALTELQMEEMWRLVDAPILCFDGDNAGRKAAARAGERALPRLKSGKSLLFASLPMGQDPDSLIGEGGKAAIEEVLAGAEPLSEQIWKLAGGGGDLATPESRAALNRRLNLYLEQIPDDDLKFYFRRHYKNRLFEPFVKSHLKRGPRLEPRRRPRDDEKLLPQHGLGKRGEGNSARRERTILQTILNFPALLIEFHEEIERLPLLAARYRAFRDALLAADVDGIALDKSKISYVLTQAGLEKLLDELVGGDAAYLDWAAKADAASLDDARVQLRHALDLHHRLIDMEKFRREAEDALAGDMSEENLQRLMESGRAVNESPGTEVQIPGYGENDNTESGRS